MYRDRFQSHRWTTTVYEGVEEQSGKKQSVTASRLPFVREEKGGGRRTSGWGEADKSWTGWTTKPFICLRFICVRAKGTRTRRLRLPTCRGTRHATNNDRPNKCKNPSSPHCFSPILLSTTNALSYIERRRIPLRQESSIRTRGDKGGRRTAKSNVEIYPTLGRENEKKGGAISPFLE